MDEITKLNEEKWDKLTQSDVLCSRPRFDLTPEKAMKWLNRNGILGDLKDKKVLCLASGGGQQSIGFALLGANVTVVDFSEAQLKKDKEISEKLSKKINIIKTDMRDLSMFGNDEFDIIYQPYSINYISETTKVFDEVSRVIKPSGIYHLMFHNPFVHGTWKDGCWGNQWDKKELWNSKGYPIWQPYEDGVEIKTTDPNWNFTNTKDASIKTKSPQEFKHTLSTILNGLIERDFCLLRIEEEKGSDKNSEPGTWDHYKTIAPPWLYIWVKKYISIR